MVELSDHDLRNLAIAAVHDLAGENVAMDVEIVQDYFYTDYPSCFFSIRIADNLVSDLTPGMFWIKLLDRLHARLLAAGDTRYPHFGVFGFYPVSQLERA
jgi:hypothetical protein